MLEVLLFDNIRLDTVSISSKTCCWATACMLDSLGVAHKGGSGAGVLQSAGSCHLLQNDLGLHTCDGLGVLVNIAVATRDGEDVLGSLQHMSADQAQSKHILHLVLSACNILNFIDDTSDAKQTWSSLRHDLETVLCRFRVIQME